MNNKETLKLVKESEKRVNEAEEDLIKLNKEWDKII